VFGVGSFDVWLRKMHVEGKRWEGAVNEIIKELVSRKRYIRFRFLSSKSDVPNSATV